jgi:hypothetical protein
MVEEAPTLRWSSSERQRASVETCSRLRVVIGFEKRSDRERYGAGRGRLPGRRMTVVEEARQRRLETTSA